jgi:ribosome biogenesis GTPase
LIITYGWSDSLRHEFASYAAAGLVPARVVVQQRGLWRLVSETGELTAQISGRFARDAVSGGYPVVGDWVAASLTDGGAQATIHHVLPRRTAFTRKAAGPAGGEQVVAANIDVAFLTASLNADLNLRRLERYLAATWQSGAEPVIVLTKADLAANLAEFTDEVETIAFGTPVWAVSALTGEGLEALNTYLSPGRTVAVVGSSGVGKSTLVNALAGQEVMSTGVIRESDDRGRHTTSHRELFLLPGGGLILDTPGMRELGLWDAEEGVGAAFGDLEALAAKCRFGDCGHTNEPGCAVRAARASGALDEGRWRGWLKLQRELAFEQAKEHPALRAERRRRWVQIAKANRTRDKLERR